jgi:recombination protein RecA
VKLSIWEFSFNIIKKSGSWFSYGDTKLGQGRDTVRKLILDNPELAQELETKILDSFSGAPAVTTTV